MTDRQHVRPGRFNMRGVLSLIVATVLIWFAADPTEALSKANARYGVSAAQDRAQDARNLILSTAKHMGAEIASDVMKHPPALPAPAVLTQFEFTDAKLGRYWDSTSERVIASIDLFFYAHIRGTSGPGGVKVEPIYVLRIVPTGVKDNVIEWRFEGQTLSARDHRWHPPEIKAGLRDGFGVARLAKEKWQEEVEKRSRSLRQELAKVTSGLPTLVAPLPPPDCDEYVSSLFDRLKPEFGSAFKSPLATKDLTNGMPVWGVLIVFAHDRAGFCFRHLEGTNSFQGDCKDWFRGAGQEPGEWVAALYLPPPSESSTPTELHDLTKLSVNGRKTWNDKISDIIFLPGDAYDGDRVYLYQTGTGDGRWQGGDIEKHPADWGSLPIEQGYHTVRTESMVGGDGVSSRMASEGHGAASSIWLHWPPR